MLCTSPLYSHKDTTTSVWLSNDLNRSPFAICQVHNPSILKWLRQKHTHTHTESVCRAQSWKACGATRSTNCQFSSKRLKALARFYKSYTGRWWAICALSHTANIHEKHIIYGNKYTRRATVSAFGQQNTENK